MSGRTFACSDLHGNMELWKAIKNFLDEDDTLYFLGDAADRGPAGWEILKDALSDSRVKYIAGNHDIMLANRIARPNNYHDASLHHCNGGEPTWDAAENDPDSRKIMLKIRKLPRYAVYESKQGLRIFMSHSGSTNIDDDEDLIWDRSEYVGRRNHTDYHVVVHGHTPIPYLIEDLEQTQTFYFQEPEQEKYPEWEGGAYWYHEFRCDIDCLTIVTNQIVLLDLDTFDEEIFEI